MQQPKIRCYRMRCWKKDDEGKIKFVTAVDGITKDADVMASAFRQNTELLNTDYVNMFQLSYYDMR